MSYKRDDPPSIQAMFSAIAKRYDRTNLMTSAGLNLLWNRALIKEVAGRTRLLDVCAGTGKVAFLHLAKNPHACCTLVDFCKEMLEIADREGIPFKERFATCVASAESLPMADESFDGATIAYGIRNICDLPKSFCEIFRVLAPQGRLSILELTRPRHPLLAFLHKHYLTHLLPWLGRLSSGRIEPYTYLSNSILHFLPPEEVKTMLLAAGFKKVTIRPLCFATATLITADK